MKILRNLCILTIFVAANQAEEGSKKSDSGHTETELLDKEYGVKYASACEGKYS